MEAYILSAIIVNNWKSTSSNLTSYSDINQTYPLIKINPLDFSKQVLMEWESISGSLSQQIKHYPPPPLDPSEIPAVLCQLWLNQFGAV